MQERRPRIYCCGVFDLCHLGHMEFFKKLHMHGDVVVGVHNNNDVMSYKRKPYMDMETRVETVKHIKYVVEVIPHAPLITTCEFMRQHNLDIIGIPEEYIPEELRNYPPVKMAHVIRNKKYVTTYYDEPISENMFVIIPRFDGISTTDIVNEIVNRHSFL